MIFRKIDLLSPHITLYHKGKISHSNIFSGLLTLIAYSIIIAMGIYFASDLIERKNPSAFYFNRYINDVGSFPLNSNSIFHFFQILSTVDNQIDSIDFDSVRFIGLEETIDNYKDNNDLSKKNHWIYGPCNESDIKGIENLIIYKQFSESACIKKYYSINDYQYHDISDPMFRWPSLDKGCSNPERTFYGVVLEKCRNDSVRFLSDGKPCKSSEEISNYMKSHSIAMQLVDQYTDVYNYDEPFIKYIYTITNGLFEESFATNHLNFNPANVRTHNGFFFDNTVDELSYFFEQNEKISATTGNSGIYVAFYFWMQNRMQYYERTYKRIQNIMADIGGMANCILFIALIINKLVSYYVTLIDTESLILSLAPNFKLNGNKKKKLPPNNDSNVAVNIHELNDQVVNNTNQRITSRNIFTGISDGPCSATQNKNLVGKVSLLKRIENDHQSDPVQSSLINPGTLSNNYLITNNFNNNVLENLNPNNKNRDIVIITKNNSNKDNKNDDSSCINIDKGGFKWIFNNKMNLGFFEYIRSFICRTDKKNKIKTYQKFRHKVLSEEHLLQNYLNIYKILKVMGERPLIKKTFEKEDFYSFPK